MHSAIGECADEYAVIPCQVSFIKQTRLEFFVCTKNNFPCPVGILYFAAICVVQLEMCVDGYVVIPYQVTW